MPHALHLHSLRCATVNAICIKPDPHGLRVEIVEIHLHFKYVVPAAGLQLHFAEAQRGPFLFQRVPPINQLRADGAFVGDAFTVG